ncbi:hypothetical protein MTP99_015839 [Tenebrio molitor]|nr:hypothetical protein MTP99_015839 [Tenebrio molitor]
MLRWLCTFLLLIRSRVAGLRGISIPGGNADSGADTVKTVVGAVGSALVFYLGPEKERNFSATGSGFLVTSLHPPPSSEKEGRAASLLLMVPIPGGAGRAAGLSSPADFRTSHRRLLPFGGDSS